MLLYLIIFSFQYPNNLEPKLVRKIKKSSLTHSTSFFLLLLSLSFVLFSIGCRGTMKSKFIYNTNYKLNEPQKESTCYDASVLLDVNLSQAKKIVKIVVVSLDVTIIKENDTYIQAKRNRKIANPALMSMLMSFRGGEILTVELKQIDDTKTFVTATTKTGFVGYANLEPLSCKIIDYIVKMASKQKLSFI